MTPRDELDRELPDDPRADEHGDLKDHYMDLMEGQDPDLATD